MNYFLILLVLFISVSTVSAEDGNFTSLQTDIETSIGSIELTQNYVYENSTDSAVKNGILINEDNFVVNGNGHTIDGSNQSRIFLINGSNVTLKNLNLINGNNEVGGAILSPKLVNIENVTFIGNTAEMGAAIAGTNLTIISCNFSDNHAKNGVVFSEEGNLKIEDSIIANTTGLKYSMLYALSEGSLIINECAFINGTSKYATAIYSNRNTVIINSAFENLTAEITAGAIALKGKQETVINDTIFVNTNAEKNGGAIFADIDSGGVEMNNVTIFNSTGDFGGAICQLDGYLIINQSILMNNTAKYDGGAIYSSNTRVVLNNSKIIGNKIAIPDNFNGGALYIDLSGETLIDNNVFTNNTKNAIYFYDSNFNITNSIFNDNGECIHAVFADKFNIENCSGNDSITLNDTDYITFVDEIGAAIELTGSNITIKDLPTKFDARDYNWVSSVKDQGEIGSCWTFGTCGALESALLKATQIEYDFSENNMQNSMIQYSRYGIIGTVEGGIREQGLVYILSWMGVLPTEMDTYDELGKISPFLGSDLNIHIQDALFVAPRNNSTDNDALKRAIIECGSVTSGYYAFDDAPYFNNNTSAYYQTTKSTSNHAISIIGWDDNYPASNFATRPEGDGAFIIKNSWGTKSGIDGYYYISYYDTSLLNDTFAIGFIINNTENYTKNYQTDFGGNLWSSNFTQYKVTYESIGNDTISAVGTYFKSNEDYTLQIYVNDKLMHTQSGTSPYYGFHTVKLTKEIPIRENDNFTALMKKDSTFLLNQSRQHYKANTTYILKDGKWEDITLKNYTVSLKVYTKELTSVLQTRDLVKIYKNESQFEATINVANETVLFEVNGINYTRTSNENGVARLNINLNPGNYTIKTTYDGTTLENNIEVLPTLISENLVKFFRNESQFLISLIYGPGNIVPNATITMNINGVFYNRTTNANGTAKLNINLNPGKYILTAIDPFTRLQISYNITVLPVLTAEDLNMKYMDGSQFKATLVDGQGKALSGVKILFNINGVFYNRTTDSNGVAKLNIRLMAGEYIITSQYEYAAISNKITITP